MTDVEKLLDLLDRKNIHWSLSESDWHDYYIVSADGQEWVFDADDRLLNKPDCLTAEEFISGVAGSKRGSY